MPGADDDHEQDLVAHEHLQNPVHPELDASRQRRLPVEPGGRRDRHIGQIPREQVPVEPLGDGHGVWWPPEQRVGRRRTARWLPEAPFIPRDAIYQFVLFNDSVGHICLRKLTA